MDDSARRACVRCGARFAQDAHYCSRCGEPTTRTDSLAPWDYPAAIRALDQSIRAGYGERTARDLRDEYAARYAASLAGETGQAASASITPSARSWPASQAGPTPAGQGARSARPSAAELARSLYPSGPPSAPPAPPQPARASAFQTFLAEQAVALTAYVAIFLLLAATLLYVVSGARIGHAGGLTQGHLDSLHVVVTVVVYFLLLGGGLGLRRVTSLRTVGQAALIMSVLTLPLVALALYLALPATAPVTPNQIVLLTACYCALIYLLLAWRIESVLFAYLGSSASVLAALAVIPSLPGRVPVEWEAGVLALATVGLLSGHALLARRLRAPESPAPLSEATGDRPTSRTRIIDPAAHVAALSSLAAFLWCEGLLYASVNATLTHEPSPVSQAAFALASIGITAAALLWYRVVRASQVPSRSLILEVDAGVIAGLSAQAVAAIASAISHDPSVVGGVMAVEALAGVGGALALRRLQPRRRALRHVVEGISVVLAAVSALFVLPAHGWLLSLALVAGALVLVGIAILEDAPWWLLGAGLATSLAYANALGIVAHAPPTEPLAPPTFFAALTAAYWAAEIVLTLRPPTRRFGLPLYVVALGNALYVLFLLFLSGQGYSGGYQSALITAFAALALLAAFFEERPRLGGAVAGAFGLLIPLPVLAQTFSMLVADRADAIGGLAALTLALAVVSLLLRRVVGRAWVAAPYGVTLWLALTTAGAAEAFGILLGRWNLASPLLLSVAVAATVASLAEREKPWAPWTMPIAAALALLGALAARDALTLVALVYAMAACGQVLARRSGLRWSFSWYIAALLCSPVSVELVARSPSIAGVPLANNAVAAILLAVYALIAFLLAAQARWPALTAVAAMYGGTATAEALWAWGPHAALGIALGAAGVGLALRLRFGWRWAVALYAVATWAAVLVGQSYQNAPRTDTLLLLGFALLAYLLGQREATPWPSTLAAPFVLWALLENQDQRLALAVLLGCVALGLTLGRLTSVKRSLPIYLVAGVAALVLLGEQQSSGSLARVLWLEAGLVYLVALVEMWAALIPVALLLGVVAVGPLADALQWGNIQEVLAYLGLSWVYAGGTFFWAAWERWQVPARWTRGAARGQRTPETAETPAASDARSPGVAFHRWGGVATAALAVLLSLGDFTTWADEGVRSLVPALAMVSLAGMLLLFSRAPRLHLLVYLGGEAVAAAIALVTAALVPGWTSAILLAPGLYQLGVGVVLPMDARLPRWLADGQSLLGIVPSLAGCVLVLVPPFIQSFIPGPLTDFYIPVLVLEALLIIGAGLASRARALVLVGAAALMLAAGRAVLIALSSGSAANLIIAVFALAFVLLSVLTVWLSYNRHARVGEAATADEKR